MKSVSVIGSILSLVIFSGIGCAKQEFKQFGQTDVGDKTFTGILAKDRDPWGGNVSTIMIVESERKEVRPPVQCRRPQPAQECQRMACVPAAPECQMVPCAPTAPTRYILVPQPAQQMRPIPLVPRPRQRVAIEAPPQQTFVMVQEVAPERCEMRQEQCEEQCERQTRVELVNTRVVNCNNQGSIGWANNALQGVVGQGLLGGGIMGGGALLRPSRIAGGAGGGGGAGGAGGGGGSSSSSSSAAAAAAASSD